MKGNHIETLNYLESSIGNFFLSYPIGDSFFMYYTSYFANIKNIDKAKYTLASITYKKPAFCDEAVLDWSFLGPGKVLLDDYKSGLVDENRYTTIYMTQLDAIWSSVKELICAHANDNIVLLCYEKPPKFCHRHLLAEFLKAKGIDCEELPIC